MRKVIITISSILGAALAGTVLWIVLLVGAFYIDPPYFKTTTTDIAEYGIYEGNEDNEAVKSYIDSFFPDRIEDYFADITYSYRAESESQYKFEAYLEFRIEDPETYTSFVSAHTKGLLGKTFLYDEAFQEYCLDDEVAFTLHRTIKKDGKILQSVHFNNARIGKILCCEKEQRIIFVAIGVSDTDIETEFLCTFLNRFKINPLEYTDNIKYSDVYQRS